MRQFALLWTFFAFVPVLRARSSSTIRGTVVDSTRTVLPSVNVRLLDKADNEVGKNPTDSDGRFYFNRVTAGEYRGTVSRTGFCPKVVPAEVGSELTIVLEIAPVREYVTVTADRGETPTSFTGAAATLLDQRAIDVLRD